MSTRSGRARTAIAAVIAAGAVLVLASPANAVTAHPNGGSGTAEDPWVPTKNAHVSCDSAHMFGNYADGSHDLKNPFYLAPKGDYIQVRYESHDGYAVMALNQTATTDNKWGFILRDCVQFS